METFFYRKRKEAINDYVKDTNEEMPTNRLGHRQLERAAGDSSGPSRL